MATHLPVIEETASSLRKDGSRNWVHPADVKGKWTTVRRVVFAVLIAIYVVMPWIEIGGHPAIFLDVDHRKFYLFGATFNAQDFWLAFFLITGMGFLLLLMTSLLGRVWCGYACPQTVFLEGVFRRVERLIEGPRNMRIKRNAEPMSFDKLWRKVLKHALFIALGLLVAHVLLSYFVSLPAVFAMVQRNPAEHPEAFGWVVGLTAVMYVNFAFFREQLCLIVCPYGRLQSVLTDKDSIIVGYDATRGEPRGKAKGKEKAEGLGDCVDCKRCVVVCPTGIDIRNGLQLDCIGCANCVDACDEVMEKLGRPKGLVRYDSLEGLEHRKTRFLRPRLALYALFGVVGLVVASLSLQSRTVYEANILRIRGPAFVETDEGGIRNSYQIHLVNKEDEARTYRLTPESEGMQFMITRPTVELPPLGETTVPVFVTVPRADMRDGLETKIEVSVDGMEAETRVIGMPFLGPDV